MSEKHYDEARVGARVCSMNGIFSLAKRKRAVLYPQYRRPVPAAMIQHQPAILLKAMLERGIYEYKKK